MRQPSRRLAERRIEERCGGTFTFWFRRPNATGHVGAWMLNQNTREAAFLTSAADAPGLGEQLELRQSLEAEVAALEHSRRPRFRLPRLGRVVRLGDPQGATLRVAIRFEAESNSPVVDAGR